MMMRYQLFFLMLIGACLASSLQAQDKHSLFFYPLAVNSQQEEDPNKFADTLRLVFFDNEYFNPILGIGYNYQFSENWAFDTKFFVKQKAGRMPVFNVPFSSASKSMKAGFQYLREQKKFLMTFGLYASFRHKVYYFFNRGRNGYSHGLVQREFGAELGIGIGYRTSERTRVSIGAAYRYSEIENVSLGFSSSRKVETLLPFESLAFAYTF